MSDRRSHPSAGVLLTAILATLAGAALGPPALARSKRVSVAVYIMSKCPYAVAAMDGLRPALEALPGAVDFQLDYIATDNNGQLESLHGPQEVAGDILQLCARKLRPKSWLGFLGCQNRAFQGIPDGWEPCADEAKIPRKALLACSEGSEGKSLLRASLRRAEAAKAQGSPTILVDGAAYDGKRTMQSFLRTICGKLTGRKPAACQKLLEDVTVRAIVLSDKRCKICETAGLESNLRARFFSKLEVKRLDYGDPAGKKLFRQLGVKVLPAIVFEKGVEKAESYGELQRWITPIGDGKYLALRVPASFDPTAEICDNKIDDNGDGKVDCADPTCTSTLVCRKEVPRLAEVLVMSQCPFAAQALTAAKEVLAALPDVTFDVHYIAEKSEGGFSSMHGQAEVDEDIRQVCARKYYHQKGVWPGRASRWLEYVWCRAKDPASTDWQRCAVGGISAAVIARCADGDEGKRLLEADIKMAAALGINASPTWLANNKHTFTGITAQAIKEKICEHNPGLKGCGKKLSDGNRSGSGAGECAH